MNKDKSAERPITLDWAVSLLPSYELKRVLQKLTKVNQKRVSQEQIDKLDLLSANLLELVWVSQRKKFVSFQDFWPEGDEDHKLYYESFLSFAEELGLSFVRWPVVHKEIKGWTYCFYKANSLDSVDVLDLYMWVRNEVEYKRLPPYMKHLYLGLIAGFSSEEIYQHIKQLKEEYGD